MSAVAQCSHRVTLSNGGRRRVGNAVCAIGRLMAVISSGCGYGCEFISNLLSIRGRARAGLLMAPFHSVDAASVMFRNKRHARAISPTKIIRPGERNVRV